MEWSDQELDELATFFARRLTTDLALVDPADPPPPGDPAALWRAKLREARDQGNLGRLAGKIADASPGDANLQQACGLLTERGGRNARQVLGAALAIGLLLVVAGTGVAAMTLAGVSRPAVVPLQPDAVVARATAAATVTPDPMAGRMSEGEGELQPDAVVPAPAPETVPTAPAAVAPPVASAQVVSGPCGGEPGQVVGYWYAGGKKPGKEGKTVVLDAAVNVRADYPDVHNGFEKRAPVKCVLQPGDKVRLDQPPIRVPGDAYWVPLVAGSVAHS